MYADNLSFEHKHFNAMDFGSYGLGASQTLAGNPIMRTNTAINWGTRNLELALETNMNLQQTGHLAQLGKVERDELIRLAKLNRINLSLHAPHYCPAGGQGNKISETARIKAVHENKQVLNFADQIGTSMKQKHVPVVVHSVEQIPGSPDIKNIMYVANRENGQIMPIEKERVSYPVEYFQKFGLKEGEHFSKTDQKGIFELYPEGKLKMINQEQLQNLKHQRANANYYKKMHEERLIRSGINLQRLESNTKGIKKEQLKKGREDIVEEIDMYLAHKEQEEKSRIQIDDMRKKYERGNELNILTPTDIMAKEFSKKSFVELGIEAYNKPSKPMIVIEQFSPEHALGDPKKTAELVKDVRKELANKLVKQKGLSRSKARKEAENIIGMNLDLGHANLWKRYGKTDKDILKDIDAVYPLLKYVHITDNFGDYDAHLPVGWGNTPINQAMKKLKDKGWKGRPMLETFGTPQYGGGSFGFSQSLYGLGSPLVSGGANWEMAEGTYFEAGYAFTTGPILPDINFQTYGAGFSGLPYATGGQIGGGKPGEKFSGTPMS